MDETREFALQERSVLVVQERHGRREQSVPQVSRRSPIVEVNQFSCSMSSCVGNESQTPGGSCETVEARERIDSVWVKQCECDRGIRIS